MEVDLQSFVFEALPDHAVGQARGVTPAGQGTQGSADPGPGGFATAAHQAAVGQGASGFLLVLVGELFHRFVDEFLLHAPGA